MEVDAKLDERLPAPVEAAAYYIARRRHRCREARPGEVVQLIASNDDQVLTLDVRDDGVGGDADRGSGVVGLTDRVEALGGTIAITSPPTRRHDPFRSSAYNHVSTHVAPRNAITAQNTAAKLPAHRPLQFWF